MDMRTESDKVRNMFTGKAGEHKVISELLFFGFNANLLSVDYGTDILAEKDGELYKVQVKTTLTRAYQLDSPTEKVKRTYQSNINLVIVFRNVGQASSTCLVLPPSLLHMLAYNDKRAPLYLNRTKFFMEGYDVFARNKTHKLSPMINRFDLIEDINSDYDMLPYYGLWADNGGIEFEFDL